MNSEQNLTREEAIAILNTPDEQLNELIERAGALRKKYRVLSSWHIQPLQRLPYFQLKFRKTGITLP